MSALLVALALTIAQPDVASRIDHVIISTAEPDTLFEFFQDTLALPVAWPMDVYAGTFVSGGVYAGNTSIEILKAPGRTRLSGIAFEPGPALEECIGLLDSAGLDHSEPMPIQGVRENGSNGLMWTSLFLTNVPLPDTMIFLCDYEMDMDAHRAGLSTLLADDNPLGLIGVREVVVGVENPRSVLDDWSVLGRPDSHESSINFEKGPSIRFIGRRSGAIESLVFDVESIDDASAFLAEHDLLQTEGDTPLIATGAAGVRIVLEQAPPELPAELLPPTPEGWRYERIDMPPAFAPDLDLKGYEELRFAPGMFEPDTDSYFSYIFSLRLEGEIRIDKPFVESFLDTYYRGLCKAVAEGRQLDVDLSTIAVRVTESEHGLEAEVDMYDTFVTGDPMLLRLEIFAAAGRNSTGLFAIASPLPVDAPIWETLRELAHEWNRMVR